MEIFTICAWIIPLVLIISTAILFYKISIKNNGPITPYLRSLKGEIVVITGADSCLGFETTVNLLEQDATVIFACRNESNAKEKWNSIKNAQHKSKVIFIPLDLTSFDSIQNFVTTLKKKVQHIDILINNAGTCFQNFELVSGVENTLFTNYLGHLLLTILLLPLFKPKGRVITVSTIKYTRYTTKSFEEIACDDNIDFSKTKKNYDWMKYYVFSKLGDMFINEYLNHYINVKRLDIKTVCLHPGYVRNPFFRSINSIYWNIRDIVMIPFRWCFFKSVKMGVQTHLHVCFIKYEEWICGGFYKDCEYWKKKPVMTLENAKRMMKFSREIIRRNNIVKDPESEVYKFLSLD